MTTIVSTFINLWYNRVHLSRNICKAGEAQRRGEGSMNTGIAGLNTDKLYHASSYDISIKTF